MPQYIKAMAVLLGTGLIALAPTGAVAADPPLLPMSETELTRPALPPILPMRDRARVENALLADRLDTVIPRLMRDQKIDMWVLVAREYFEDPVVATMLNAESMPAGAPSWCSSIRAMVAPSSG